ncbi:hypothetical protein [Hyphomonas oceanitis]|uniref:Alpha-acetolactate decarboxylase n=1 Tax=Hyphomonas oceanitis SCH89 TaxID=1280953 RepID=A0A059G2Z2_9PROT|nr:hypothetical protein [Hyphomonas oceanitis]KDA00900.1 alpha-acetolactate decarboxylase [Hyphomonas oceanitis SCH89]
MRRARYATILSFALISACKTPQAEPQASLPDACKSAITAYGSRAALKANPNMVAVNLAAVPTPATAIGYGPSSGYRAELTLVDGNWFIARATGADPVQVETVPGKDAGAVFFVSAAPEVWSARPVGTTITSMAGLESILAEAAAASDCPSSAIPFRLSGTITGAEWSVVGRPEGAKGQIKSGNVTLVGIYDPFDPDRYFMPSGQQLHVHLVSDDGTISGHLSSFSRFDDGVLSLPEQV